MTPVAAPAGRWPALAAPPAVRHGIGVTIVNFNTSAQTLRCIESLRASETPPDWVVVLDNASQGDDFERLRAGCAPLPHGELRLYRSETNLGFAAGSNVLFAELLAEPECRWVLLLNNDAVAQPRLLGALQGALQSRPSAGLAGARMHKLHAPSEVDTLGICLYASLMPADRLRTDDPFLGPTGGCCMLARGLLEELRATAGYWFDPRYFCYWEDTDLVLRAVLLGYEPVYLDEVLAFHEGQASSGKGYNPFIAYHAIRNSVWVHAKLMPPALFVRYGALLLLSHAMMLVQHTLMGQLRMALRAYRDAWRQLPAVRAERRHLQAHARLGAAELRRRIAPRFYRRGYFSLAAASMLARLRPRKA